MVVVVKWQISKTRPTVVMLMGKMRIRDIRNRRKDQATQKRRITKEEEEEGGGGGRIKNRKRFVFVY